MKPYYVLGDTDTQGCTTPSLPAGVHSSVEAANMEGKAQNMVLGGAELMLAFIY